MHIYRKNTISQALKSNIFDSKLYNFIMLSVIAFVISSCSNEIENKGYVTKFSDFDKVQVGQTKEQIASILGSPTVVSNVGEEVWIYAGSEVTKESFFKPKVKTYNAYKIKFNKNGLVEDISTKNKENMNKIAVAEETTETGGNEVTFIQQLLGNLGRYNPGGGDGRIAGNR
jgi:outer membrane protein assembly factor BamE (lipoprotein component of BamABCDE complex)